MFLRFLIRLLPAAILWSLVTAGPASAARFSKVVIDAGHGGHDNGARIGYIYEKHLALDVARRLDRFLQDRGISTAMTRQTDVFLSLEDRAAVANRTRNSILVSVHFNMVNYSGPTGTETWYYSQDGYPLAAAIQQSVAAGLGTVNRGVKFARYKVLRSCSRPAVIVEGGFISTKRDLQRCLDPKYRQRLAEAIGDAILRYRRS
ncbi:MAG: N-acetylmuramoyl-L-alanine amidase [Verrucomicrobiales bacterium]|nr:N-acetylmuramoyl-L-alanine amidase [Verrucomicrobiales bacterium]